MATAITLLATVGPVSNLAMLTEGVRDFTPYPPPFGDAFGIAVREDEWAVVAQGGVTRYRQRGPGRWFPWITAHNIGDSRPHEMVYEDDGRLVIAASILNALLRVDDQNRAVPIWKGGQHVNGVGLRDGKVRYVSMFQQTPGFVTNRGLVVDVLTGEHVLTGLTCPHSPRWHDGALWVADSGTGRLLRDGKEVCRLPGFVRGLCFNGDTAFVGTSERRPTFPEEEMSFDANGAVCAVWAVDTRTGENEMFVKISPYQKELFDIQIVPPGRIYTPDSSEDMMEKLQVLRRWTWEPVY